jgi:hypothetical protein
MRLKVLRILATLIVLVSTVIVMVWPDVLLLVAVEVVILASAIPFIKVGRNGDI